MIGRGSLRRVVLRTLLRTTLGASVLFVLIWVAAAKGVGMDLVVPRLLARAVPDGWTVEVGIAEGDWRSHVRIRDIELRGPDGSATVDELALEYRLLPLLGRMIDVRRIHVVRPVFEGTLAAGAKPGHAMKPAGEGIFERLIGGSPAGDWTLALADLRIDDARAVLTGSWGAYRVERASLAGSATLSPQGTSVDVDSLVAEVIPPPAGGAKKGDGTGWLYVAARLNGGMLAVHSLSFHSPRSRLEGAGNLLLAAVPGYLDRVEFALDADPLDLRDLPLELPERLVANPLVTLHATASGPPDSMVVDLDARGPGSARVRAHAIVRARSTGDAWVRAVGGPALHLDATIAAALSEWGIASPFDGDMSADVEVALDELDATSQMEARATVVHRSRAGASPDLLGSDVRLDARLTRQSPPEGAPDTAKATLDVSAVLYRPSVAAEWTEVGAVAAQGTTRRAAWQVDLMLDSGSVAGSGRTSWVEDVREVVVDELTVQRLDLASVTARFPPSSINAHLEGYVSGNSTDDLTGRVALSLGASSFGESSVDTLSLAADLVPGSLTGVVVAEADAGHLESDYHVVLRDSVVEATVARLEATATVDSTVSAVPAWSVRGQGSGTWSRGAERWATLMLDLDSSAVGGIPVTGATLDGELIGDSLTARARADIVALGSSAVSLTATAAGRGTSVDDVVGVLEIQAARFHVVAADAVTRSGPADSLVMRVAATTPGAFEVVGALLPAEGGRVDLTGDVRALGTDLTFELAAEGGLATPAEMLRGGSIERVLIEASGVRLADRWDRVASEFLVTGGTWRGVVADTLWSSTTYDSSGLRVDTLALISNVLTLAASGILPAAARDSGSIELTANFDLEPLRDHTDAELPTIGGNELTVSVTGTTDSVDVALSAAMTALVHRKVRVSGFEAEAHALLERPFRDLAGLTTTTASVRLDRILLPDAEMGNVTASLVGDPEGWRLEASALVDENRRGELDARIDPTTDWRAMEVGRLELQLDEDEWTLSHPATLSFRDGFALRAFRLEAGDQSISIDGGVTEAGAFDLTLDMDSTDIGTVADLVGYPLLDGWIGGRARLEGTTDAPVGTVDLVAGYHEEGGSPTTVRLRVESDGRRAVTDIELQDPDGGVLVVDGMVPLQDGEEVDLRVDAEGFAIASAIVFIDAEQMTELEGRIDAHVAVSGTTHGLRFDGPLSLENGLAHLPSLGVTWEEIGFVGRGDGTTLRIDSGSVQAGSGSMAFSGSVAADSLVALDLDLELDEFQAIQTNMYQAAVSGDLHAGGHLNAPEVEGRLDVASLDVYIDERVSDGGLEDVELDAADLETLRERFGYIAVEEDLQPDRTDLITADLVVELGRDSWIRSRSTPQMAVAFSGDVTVRLRPGEEPHVEGTLTTVPDRGYIAQFGKRFSPQDGTVTLDGPPASAELDLSASYTIPSHANPDGAEATILLGVKGTRDDLALSLSSEPPMENADIVSYIATGRPSASTLAIGDADAEADTGEPIAGLAGAGAGLAVGQILTSIETAARTGVGLDVVEIRREGIRGATLAAGKYVSPRLYIGFAQPLMHPQGDGLSLGDQDGSEVEIEFLAIKGLLLNLEGSASALSLFLRGRLAY